MSATDNAGEAALSLHHLSKSFGGERALKDTDLFVRAGEIHGLVGRNGSGKSTLIKILSGFYGPDPGAECRLAGQSVRLPLEPASARALGLVFVHQDLALAPGCSVLENMRIGRYSARGLGRIDWQLERDRVSRGLHSVGLDLDPETTVERLRPVERAQVAIARALDEAAQRERGVLVLDEPTTFLPRGDIASLFDAVRRVVSRGFSAIFVSHRVEEIKQVTDSVSVLRDGVRVATRRTSDVSENELVELILGQPLSELYPPRLTVGSDLLLSVGNLTGGCIRDLSFSMRQGEIVGVTGIAGMGHDNLPYLLFGAEPVDAGTLEQTNMAPQDLKFMTPKKAMARGIGLVPSDRLRRAGVPAFTVRENVSLPAVWRHFTNGVLHHYREQAEISDLLRTFLVRPPETEIPLGTLSGGNQQKALLAKWLQMKPEVLLLHDPTQGIDVGAKKEIFVQIEDAAARGAAVLISSTDCEDLAHLCHRVLVFRDGEVSAELQSANLSEESIVQACYRQN
jgi:ribose transport system ATP-binding protein